MIARKVTLGVLFVCVLIFMQIFAAIAFIFDLPTVYEPDKLVIFHLNHLYAYISVLMAVRYLTCTSEEVNKYLKLIIRLEILKVLTSIFLVQLASFLSLVLIALYVSLFVAVFKKENNEVYEIDNLRPTFSASAVSFAFAIMLALLCPRNNDVLGIVYLINMIPYFFLTAYLLRMKSRIQKKSLV